MVTVPHDRAYVPPTTMTVHRIDELAPSHLDAVHGFPTTTPARTVIDLAAVVTDFRLCRAIESAVVERRATFSQIDRVLRDVRRQGKPGVTRLTRVLETLGGEPPAMSFLERELHTVIRLAGVDAVRHHPLPWHREPIVGCVDARYPPAG